MKRLLLFDVDGTLLTGGPAKEAFHLALLEVYGTAGPIDGWEFSGKTDPQIARELLRAAGLDDEVIDQGMPALWARYLGEMERRLAADPTVALPGTAVLLDALEAEGESALGLVTGNVSQGAELKLAAAGFHGRFAVGAFGSDHEERNELPGIALARARVRWQVSFEPRAVVVLGDTPRDVECALHIGARAVGVATGRFDTVALARAGAHVVLDDLSETERVLEALAG